MSTAPGAAVAVGRGPADHRRAGGRPDLRAAVAGEWVKARSARSTWAALGLFLTIMVAVGAAVTGTLDPGGLTAAERDRLNPVQEALSGVFMGQVVLGVLGGLMMSGEYATRSITTSLLAVPSRSCLLGAKALVLVAIVLPAAVAAVVAAFLVGSELLQSNGIARPTESGGGGAGGDLLLRVGLGAPTYLVLIAVIGLAVGTITRSTASTVVALTFVLFLLPVLLGLVPPLEPALPWLPSQAGQAVLQPAGTPGYLDPWAGLAVLSGYAAASVLAAWYTLGARDA